MLTASNRYRWVVLSVGVSAQGAFSAYSQGLGSLGPVFQRHFGISLVQTGALLTGVSIGTALTLVAWGMLADRLGERLVLAVGLAGGGLWLAAASLAPSYPVVLACLIAAGMFGACSISASGRAVMGWFGTRERGMALGIRQMATPLGGGLAAAILPLVALGYGLGAGLLTVAAGCLLAALASAIWIRTPPGPPGGTRDSGRHPLADRRIWRLAVGGSLLVGGQLSLVSYLVLFLSGHRGLPLQAAAAVLAAVQLGGAASRVLVGVWSDHRRGRLGLMRLIALAGTATFAAVAGLADGPLVLLLPVLFLTGVISMSSNGLAFTATGEIAGLVRSATAMGFQNTVLFVSGTIFPIAFGVAVTFAGWRFSFAAMAVLAGLGWLVLRPLEQQEGAGWAATAA